MKDYAWLRENAQTGDALSVESRRLGGILIRMLTAEKASHIASLLWLEEGLFVAEMLAFGGFTISPASEWIPKNCKKANIWFSPAPQKVHDAPDVAKGAALKYRKKRYSWITLVSVWVSQIIRRKTPSGLVCSTLLQRMWEACGVVFEKTADPGDIVTMSGSSTLIKGC